MEKVRFAGELGEYRWFQASDLFLGQLTAVVPEVVLDRTVVVTSCDSGRLRLTAEERQAGWSMVGDVAVSPRIGDPALLPHDQAHSLPLFAKITIGTSFACKDPNLRGALEPWPTT